MGKFGYARVSSDSQCHELQVQRLKEYGCSPVRAEKVSGKSLVGRDELTSLMEFLRAGDELVVVKLDRLGRSTRDVLNLVHDLEQKGAFLTVLEPAFSTKDATGHVLVTVLGMVSELERGFIRDRQRAGVEAARARGVYKGRVPTIPVDRVLQLKASGLGPTAISQELGISRMHVHRLLRNSDRSQKGET